MVQTGRKSMRMISGHRVDADIGCSLAAAGRIRIHGWDLQARSRIERARARR